MKRTSSISSISSTISSIFKQKPCEKYETYVKNYIDKTLFDNDIYIIAMFNKYNIDIIPEILHIQENYIEYQYKDIYVLREILNNKNINYHHLINELLSFFKILKIHKIFIGHLHIDNIYVNIKTLKCYIIDLSNVKFIDKKSDLNFQSLYISLYNTKCIEESVMRYMDDQLNIFNTVNYNESNFVENLIDLYND
jgi:hypothetical protein